MNEEQQAASESIYRVQDEGFQAFSVTVTEGEHYLTTCSDTILRERGVSLNQWIDILVLTCKGVAGRLYDDLPHLRHKLLAAVAEQVRLESLIKDEDELVMAELETLLEGQKPQRTKTRRTQ